MTIDDKGLVERVNFHPATEGCEADLANLPPNLDHEEYREYIPTARAIVFEYRRNYEDVRDKTNMTDIWSVAEDILRVRIAEAIADAVKTTRPSPALPADNAGLVARLRNPNFADSPTFAAAYMREAADRIEALARQSAATADDAGLVADLEHMWHFPVPPGDKSARMYSDTAKRAAEVLSGREWQPIETAPKDGTDIIVYCPTYKAIWPAYYPEDPDYDGHAWRRFDHAMIPEPSHWMPLPTPPAASQPAGGEGE